MCSVLVQVYFVNIDRGTFHLDKCYVYMLCHNFLTFGGNLSVTFNFFDGPIILVGWLIYIALDPNLYVVLSNFLYALMEVTVDLYCV